MAVLVIVLAAAERKLGPTAKLASMICDSRDPLRVVHLLLGEQNP
jgi:hypothetical protein